MTHRPDPARRSPFPHGGVDPGLMLAQGAAAGREAVVLSAELVRIALGRSEIAPARADRRFTDVAWKDNPAYARLAQSYLAGCATVDHLVDNLEELEWPHTQSLRFLVGIATSAAAPTNFLITNPAALKRAFDTGGRSLVRGLSNRVSDILSNRGMPAMVKKGVLSVGSDLAVTPGSVVTRDPIAELIQYEPTTAMVRERPTLIVPPPIGRYYFLDLVPGRSFVEHSVDQGLQTFMLSWHNPSPSDADRDLDMYAARVLDAIDEVKEITGQEDVNVIGFCAGGLIAAVALNRLAADGNPAVHASAFAVTLIDFGGGNPIDVFGSAAVRSLAGWGSRRKGVIDAQTMGSAFTWMRPNDLVWNYWVNNYLLGEDPPVFDILAWNADGTNLPARLHEQFLEIFGTNSLGENGRCSFLGAPFDLGKVDHDNFVVGAVDDHLTPWRGTYRTTQMTKGHSTYVLSNAGHIASLVNPPGNAKANYFTGPDAGTKDADSWKEGASQVQGSWWSAWADWTVERSGAEVPAPAALGSVTHPALEPAPGSYVRDEPTA